jgi:hypothetical protein
MASPRVRPVPYSRQVFLNCPFDDEYCPLLRSAVFTIHGCGFTARIALENTGSENVRLDRLIKMIGECEFGIHDLSRVRSATPSGLPRFNMPFERGVFYGAWRFGQQKQRRKRFLLLDTEPYQYEKTMCDAAGLDPRAHYDDPEKMIACIRDFLAAGLDPKPIGPTRILALYKESNRILGVNTAQWRQVDLQAQLQTTRLDAEGVGRCCFGIEQSIFAAPHTPRIRLLSTPSYGRQSITASRNPGPGREPRATAPATVPMSGAQKAAYRICTGTVSAVHSMCAFTPPPFGPCMTRSKGIARMTTIIKT